MSATIYKFPQRKICHWNQIQPVKRAPHPFDLCFTLEPYRALRGVLDINEFLALNYEFTTHGRKEL